MKFPSFTIRSTLVLVLVVALGMAAVLKLRQYHALRQDYIAKARAFQSEQITEDRYLATIQAKKNSRSDAFEDSRSRALERASHLRFAHYSLMTTKYAQLANRPWKEVPSDPLDLGAEIIAAIAFYEEWANPPELTLEQERLASEREAQRVKAEAEAIREATQKRMLAFEEELRRLGWEYQTTMPPNSLINSVADPASHSIPLPPVAVAPSTRPVVLAAAPSNLPETPNVDLTFDEIEKSWAARLIKLCPDLFADENAVQKALKPGLPVGHYLRRW